MREALLAGSAAFVVDHRSQVHKYNKMSSISVFETEPLL